MIIKCCKNGGELNFAKSKKLDTDYFRVTINSNHLSSFADVYIPDPFDSHLVKFFEDLGKNWKGFDGEKKWKSLEEELVLICTSDNTGHFGLEVTISNSEKTRCAKKTIYIESGQLETILFDARNFFNIL